MKRCKKCGALKDLGEFYRAAGMRDGHRSECKACNLAAKKAWYQRNRTLVIAKVKRWQRENKEIVNAQHRAYREANPTAMREWHLSSKFGISIADYERLLEAQDRGCAVCGKPPGKISLHVDHDHESGKVRGLLCVGCNNALGQFKDSPELLARATSYLVGELETFATLAEMDALAVARAGELRTTPV